MADSSNPERIAQTTRALVAKTLAQLGYVPPRPDFLGRLEVFAETLALWGSKLNLTSAPDDPAELAFHILDSLAPLILARSPLPHDRPLAPEPTGGAEQPGNEVERLIGDPARLGYDPARLLTGAFNRGIRVLDLGSGAGFPSLVLAAACDADFTLLEARRKRASFLMVAAAAMGLINVQVEARREMTGRTHPQSLLDASRSESLTLDPVFDVVTARAFAEPKMVYRTASAALKPGGRAIIYISPAQESAIERVAGDLFDPPIFLSYDVSRGAVRVRHTIAISRCGL